MFLTENDLSEEDRIIQAGFGGWHPEQATVAMLNDQNVPSCPRCGSSMNMEVDSAGTVTWQCPSAWCGYALSWADYLALQGPTSSLRPSSPIRSGQESDASRRGRVVTYATLPPQQPPRELRLRGQAAGGAASTQAGGSAAAASSGTTATEVAAAAEQQLPVSALSPATQKQRDFLATLALAQGAPVPLVLALYGQTKPDASNALTRLTKGGALLDPRTGRLSGRSEIWIEAATVAQATQTSSTSSASSSRQPKEATKDFKKEDDERDFRDSRRK